MPRRIAGLLLLSLLVATCYRARDPIDDDEIPPGPVTGFEATAASTPGQVRIVLSWTKPDDGDLASILVLRKAGSAPSDPTDADAQVVVDALVESHADEDIADAVAYHYRAWAVDRSNNRSAAADAGPVLRLVDDDGDGEHEQSGDCDDTDSAIHHGTACDDGDPGSADERCLAGACLAGCAQNAAGYEQCQPPAGGATFIVIPAGSFTMGCNTDVEPCSEDYQDAEMPAHALNLSAFAVDLTPVTQGQYKACVDAGVCENIHQNFFDPAARPDHPVVAVNWSSAGGFCEWAGKRLCTEAEWERAARGTDSRIYPWGNDPPDCAKANYAPCGLDDINAVFDHPDGASAVGALEMAGNIWEWVFDWYGGMYYTVSPSDDPQGPASGEYKVGKSGAYHDPADYLRSAMRGWGMTPEVIAPDIGFRCCRSLP